MAESAGQLEAVGRPIVLATHRRSGTHLTLDLLRRQVPACRARKRWGEGLDTLYLSLEALLPPWNLPVEGALARLGRAPRPLVKTHARPGLERFPTHSRDFAREVVARATVLAIHRDVRDVLSSLHHYGKSLASEPTPSLSAFIQQKDGGVSRPRAWADHVRAWRDTSALSLAYEEIVADPGGALAAIAKHCELEPRRVEPLLPRPLRERWQVHAARLFSRDPDATNVLGAPGRPLRWREALSREDRAFIHAEAGDLLIELGYEDSDAWVDDARSTRE